MELPSAREIELEILIRARDAQITELSDEVNQLRRYLSTQPGPSTTDPVTLPPALVSLLLPHIQKANDTVAPSSSTVNNALLQRTKLLQEENDELFDLLKRGETGKLKEEVRGLRRVVTKLEGALKESHQTISDLSAELEQSYDSFLSSNRRNLTRVRSQSPEAHRNVSNGASGGKLPPTGPRAHKKPRLSEVQHQPPSSSSQPPSKPSVHQRHSDNRTSKHSNGGPSASEPKRDEPSGGDGRNKSGGGGGLSYSSSSKSHQSSKMDTDEDRKHNRDSRGSGNGGHSHDRERERLRDSGRGSRDSRDRGRRRNGGGGVDGGRSDRHNDPNDGGDRDVGAKNGIATERLIP